MANDCTCTHTVREDSKGRKYQIRVHDANCPVHQERTPPPGFPPKPPDPPK